MAIQLESKPKPNLLKRLGLFTILLLVVLVAAAYLRYRFEIINTFADRVGLSPILQSVEDTCNGFLQSLGIYPVSGSNLLTAGGITATGIGVVSKFILPKLQAEQAAIREKTNSLWSNSLSQLKGETTKAQETLSTELGSVKEVTTSLQTQVTNLQTQIQNLQQIREDNLILTEEKKALTETLQTVQTQKDELAITLSQYTERPVE